MKPDKPNGEQGHDSSILGYERGAGDQPRYWYLPHSLSVVRGGDEYKI
jgi:hypothetical protein